MHTVDTVDRLGGLVDFIWFCQLLQLLYSNNSDDKVYVV